MVDLAALCRQGLAQIEEELPKLKRRIQRLKASRLMLEGVLEGQKKFDTTTVPGVQIDTEGKVATCWNPPGDLNRLVKRMRELGYRPETIFFHRIPEPPKEPPG